MRRIDLERVCGRLWGTRFRLDFVSLHAVRWPKSERQRGNVILLLSCLNAGLKKKKKLNRQRPGSACPAPERHADRLIADYDLDQK